jgi:hypothetical protein
VPRIGAATAATAGLVPPAARVPEPRWRGGYGPIVDPRVARPTWIGIGSFLAGLGACVAIRPRDVLSRDEGGISNYGVHAGTAAPYTAAFLLGAAGLWVAGARAGRVRVGRRASTALRGVAVLLVVVLATTYPYQHGHALRDLHVAAGALAVVGVTAASAGAAVAVRRPPGWCALAVELAGALLGLTTLLGATHLLFASQALVALGGGALGVLAAARLDAAAQR